MNDEFVVKEGRGELFLVYVLIFVFVFLSDWNGRMNLAQAKRNAADKNKER